MDLLNAKLGEEIELGHLDLGADYLGLVAHELEPSCEYATSEPADMDPQFIFPGKTSGHLLVWWIY